MMRKNYLRVFESWKSLRESRKYRHMGGEKKNRKIKDIPASKSSAKADREKSISERGEKKLGSRKQVSPVFGILGRVTLSMVLSED